MRVAIVGDSFAQCYDNTVYERIVKECGLTLVDCRGFSGHSQYKIYTEYMNLIDRTDVIICCHTEYSRLYHPRYSINPHLKTFNHDDNMDKNVVLAAEQYYYYLYNEDYAKTTYKLLIDDMQRVAQNRGIKVIHLPGFDIDFINQSYGLWFNCRGGFTALSRADLPNWDSSVPDMRPNHFSERGHNILAEHMMPHIKSYLGGDFQYHVALLFPELFS